MTRQPAGPGTDEFPYWLAAAVVIAIAVAIAIALSDLYWQIFWTVLKGLWVTLFVTVVAFALASLIGLGFALMALARSRWMREVSRFYVEIVRGIPMLVLLFWIAFVGAPVAVAGWNWATWPLQQAGLIRRRDGA